MYNATLLLAYAHAHTHKFTQAHAQKFLAVTTHTHTHTHTPIHANTPAEPQACVSYERMATQAVTQIQRERAGLTAVSYGSDIAYGVDSKMVV